MANKNKSLYKHKQMNNVILWDNCELWHYGSPSLLVCCTFQALEEDLIAISLKWPQNGNLRAVHGGPDDQLFYTLTL